MATYLLYPVSPHLPPNDFKERLARLNSALKDWGSHASLDDKGMLSILVPPDHLQSTEDLFAIQPNSRKPRAPHHGRALSAPEFLTAADTHVNARLILQALPKQARLVIQPDGVGARARKSPRVSARVRATL